MSKSEKTPLCYMFICVYLIDPQEFITYKTINAGVNYIGCTNRGAQLPKVSDKAPGLKPQRNGPELGSNKRLHWSKA